MRRAHGNRTHADRSHQNATTRRFVPRPSLCYSARRSQSHLRRSPSHARVGHRFGRTRTRAVLGARGQPAADQTLVRARQPRHRRRWPSACRSACSTSPLWSPSQRTTRSTWSSPARRPRWSPASPTRWRPPASPAAAPRAPRPSLKAARASPRKSATPPAFPPRNGNASTTPKPPAIFVRRRGAPIVVKADGLAAGKGVVVAATEAEALAAIDAMMEARAFGEAGASVVIEECLTGDEISLFALCDGETALLLGSAQDHKRVGDGDTGPNTGGMGAYAPAADVLRRALEQAAMDRDRSPRAGRDGAPRHAVPRHPVRRPDAHRRRREGDRVQRAVRRPGVPGAAAAPEIRPVAGVAGGLRRRTRAISTCAGPMRRRSAW